MGNIMAGAACLILIMDFCTVRLAMAVLTGHQLTMIRMAFRTGQGGMLGLLHSQLIVRIGMTTAADLFILVKRIGYLQRRMHRVTGQTVSGRQLGSRAVRIMTLRTLRYSAVFLGVAGRAVLLGMHAGLGLQASGNLGMTDPALSFDVCRCRDGHQRLMGILMAVQTFYHRLRGTVWGIMTAAALGHNLRVVVFHGIIGMKHLVALHTQDTGVFCPFVLDPAEVRRMAAATIRHRERFNLNIIHTVFRCGPGWQAPQQEGCACHSGNHKSQSFLQ